MGWVDVAASADVEDDEPAHIVVNDKEIGLFRVDGAVYAIEDVCPHAYALLSQGFVEGEEVECPLHGAIFHIPSGKCLKEPGERDLVTYPAKEEGGRILIDA